jgi:hypothetical protein
MCDCLLCVEIADIKAGRKCVTTKNYYVLFMFTVYRKCFDTNERLYAFSFLSYRCHYFPSPLLLLLLFLLLLSLLLIFPRVFSISSSVFAVYANHQSTPHLYSYKPVTHYTYYLFKYAAVCNSAITNHWPIS